MTKKLEKGWYRYADDDTVLIFIHGLMSNCIDCWKNKNGKVWPEIIISDARFNNTSIYLAEYYTDKTSGDYNISQCAQEVMTRLENIDESMRDAPINKKNIIFVAHSAGGIIARYIVETNRQKFTNKKVGFFLIASPSYGSQYNIVASVLIKLFGHALATELKWASPILVDLDDRFRNLIESREIDICGREIYENKNGWKERILYNRRKIVGSESARRYFDSGVMIPGSNHSSICKPPDITHPSHAELYRFIFEKFPLRKKQTPFNVKKIVADEPSSVLFNRYNIGCEQYYIHRDVDKQLESMFGKYSIWVSGCTGVGKTVSIQRILHLREINYRFISLATSVNESISQMFADLLHKLNVLTDSQSSESLSRARTLGEISDRIGKLYSNGVTTLFIEEIPVKNHHDFVEFCECFFSIITTIRTDIGRCNIILSSIFEPPDTTGTEFEKISEIIKIVKVSPWSREELTRLISLIESVLECPLVTRPDNLDSFNSSPRAIKNHYADYMFDKRTS
jgi:hypothetical protein